jgi:hypothetical protein
MTISALGQFTALSLIPAAIVPVECSTFSLNIVGAIINNQQRDLDMRDHLFHRGFAGLDVAVAEKCLAEVMITLPSRNGRNLISSPLPLATKLRHPQQTSRTARQQANPQTKRQVLFSHRTLSP